MGGHIHLPYIVPLHEHHPTLWDYIAERGEFELVKREHLDLQRYKN